MGRPPHRPEEAERLGRETERRKLRTPRTSSGNIFRPQNYWRERIVGLQSFRFRSGHYGID